jgi:hypothetical protein
MLIKLNKKKKRDWESLCKIKTIIIHIYLELKSNKRFKTHSSIDKRKKISKCKNKKK